MLLGYTVAGAKRGCGENATNKVSISCRSWLGPGTRERRAALASGPDLPAAGCGGVIRHTYLTRTVRVFQAYAYTMSHALPATAWTKRA